MTSMQPEHREIADVVEQYRRGVAGVDAPMLKEIWAHDHADLVYVASELARPMRHWREIARYYDGMVSSIRSVETMDVADLTVEATGDFGYAFFRARCEGWGADEDEHFSVDITVTVVLQRRDDGWKVIHFHESTPGSL